MADEDVVVAKKKRTLLEKYDIPVSHLNYEYVKKCNEGKELERIVKILRSGEEGLYPDLEKCAANRLSEIMPGSRMLRVEEPVLTKSTLGSEHWNQVNNDLTNWSSEMKCKEQELKSVEDSFVTVNVPGIRCDKIEKSSKTSNEEAETKKMKSFVPKDYSEWDKYDPDKEILKMEIEEERRKEDLERKQRVVEKEALKMVNSRSKIVESAGVYSNTEKQFLAIKEKDKGNEYFKVHEYKQAIEHYSASIAIDPTPVAYNNRAMARIKLELYWDALQDASKVLELEPTNVKALHRRGIAYKHQKDYQNALDDFLRILRLEPNNHTASSLAQEMQAKLDSNQRAIRMQISEEGFDSEGPKMTEVLDEPDIEEPCIQDPSMKMNTSWPAPPDPRVKCNEFGLPKIMCNCSGVPDWVHRPPPRCLTCKEIKERRRAQQLREASSSPKDSNISHARSNENSESDDECECEQTFATLSAPEKVISEIGTETSVSVLSSSAISKETADGQNETCADVTKNIGDNARKEEANVSRAAHSKSAATSPKVQIGRRPEARRLLPTESVKPVKVQVASKYTTKSVVKGEEETSRGVAAIQGLSLDDGISENITTPFEFVNALQAAKGKDVTLLAPVLQRVDPSILHLLIGNKLDDFLLRSILDCLLKCFMDNGPLVLKFLENLAALPRFRIVKMFLDSKTTQVVQELFESLAKQGCHFPSSLQEAYRT